MSCTIKEASIILRIPTNTLHHYVHLNMPHVKVKTKRGTGSGKIYINIAECRRWIAKYKAGKIERLCKAIQGKPRKEPARAELLAQESMSPASIKAHLKAIVIAHMAMVRRQVELAEYKSGDYLKYSKMLADDEQCLKWIGK